MIYRERNISALDVIISKFKCYITKINSFLNYRRTYSNYITIVIHHLREEFPVRAVLRNGRHIILRDDFQAYTVSRLQRHHDISYDVDNDRVTVSLPSNGKDIKRRVNLEGGVTNGEVVECFLNGAYDRLPVRGKTVIDVGSNIGDSPIYFALRGAIRVIGIEPFLNNYEAAKKNVEINDLTSIIVILLAGCAANEGYAVIKPSHRSNVSGILSRNIAESADGIRVPLLTLETILNRGEIPPGQIILKMDCEGCEYETILSATEDVLRRFSHIQIEYHSGYKNLKERLENVGFEVSVSRPIQSGRLLIGYIYAKRN